MTSEYIKNYLESLRQESRERNPNRYRFFSFVLEEGKGFDSLGSSELEEQVEAESGQCYGNSQLLLIEDRLRTEEGLSYFEGWGLTAVGKEIGVPLRHGWCVKDGRVVDITWVDGVGYFGVEIPEKYILEKICEDMKWKPLLTDYFFEVIDDQD